MKILLIRHTRVAVPRGICYGDSNIELATTFKEDILAATSKVTWDDYALFSSPLSRCHQLAAALNKEIIFDDRLKELNYGDWENIPWEQIEQVALKQWKGDIGANKAPNGESFNDMRSRCIAFYDELQKSNYENVVIVSHGGWIRTLIASILGFPMQNLFRLNIDYGSASLIETDPLKPMIHYVNR